MPCDGYANHGGYVSAFAQAAFSKSLLGLISDTARAALVRAAAQSACPWRTPGRCGDPGEELAARRPG